MSNTGTVSANHLLAAEITREFDAPPSLVFRNWMEPEHVQAWFAAEGYTAVSCVLDPRPGGRWRVEFTSDEGRAYAEEGRFLEVVPDRRLVFTLTQLDGEHTGPETTVEVTFTAVGRRTRMEFRQTGFDSAARRDGNAEGWRGCFDKLAAHLAVM